MKQNDIINRIILGDCTEILPNFESESVHLMLSDIPYGIGVDEWDVLHNNSNSALLGASPAQKGSPLFKKRGKPLNGWADSDRKIPKEYYDWCMSWTGECFRLLKPGGSAIIFAGRRFAHRCICAFEDSGFTYKDMICWKKERAPHRAQRLSVVFDRRGDDINCKKWAGWKLGNLRPIFEPILWFVKPYKIGGTIADNMIENGLGAYNEDAFLKYVGLPDNYIQVVPSASDTGLHPTQKPIVLMKALIELTTVEKQTVLDPFCGSGTTLVASMELNRNFIGIEKEEEFYETANSRIQSCTKISQNIPLHYRANGRQSLFAW